MHRWPNRRCKPILLLAVVILIAGLRPPSVASAQAGVTVVSDRTSITFPDSIQFSVDLEAENEIQQVVLEYRVAQQTCGTVIAKAFPEITPGKSVHAEWTWEMKQSGALPPGATISWQWRVSEANGNETLTPEQSVTWLDDIHNWAVISGDLINLHWYEGSQSFGKELHDAAVASLADLQEQTGLYTDTPVDIYVYASFDDLREAILYEPGWVGGQAFPEYNIVIVGISTDNLAWGKSTNAHELTHVLVGHLTFSCLGYVPTWLNEGLAMYGEGGPDPASQSAFKQAVEDDTLFSVRALSGGFSEASDKADLSYSQSYSLVKFLIETYGKDQIMEMLKLLREGATPDEALQKLYGFDLDGLEDAWRAAIGAAPRQVTADATPTSEPTLVPTYAPVSAIYASPTPTTAAPTVAATSISPTVEAMPESPTPEQAQPSATPASRRTARPTVAAPTPTDEAANAPMPDDVRNALSFGSICVVMLVVMFAFYFAVLRRPRHRRKSL